MGSHAGCSIIPGGIAPEKGRDTPWCDPTLYFYLGKTTLSLRFCFFFAKRTVQYVALHFQKQVFILYCFLLIVKPSIFFRLIYCKSSQALMLQYFTGNMEPRNHFITMAPLDLGKNL